MFCSRCGAQMQPSQATCSNCGRQVGDLVRAVAYTRLDRHLPIVSGLWIAVGGLFGIPAIFLVLFGSQARLIFRGHEPFGELFPVFIYLVGGTLLILSAGGICVGMGLMQRRSWARTAALVLSVLSLFHPPLGTALGVYTLWVLLADEGGQEYEYLARAS